ncbi:MAG: hypothetical protein KDJ35_00175 [Alphaproteobacteria bacterium]|nr:hypothetical protein [Alphaproteobacteria bacterium]
MGVPEKETDYLRQNLSLDIFVEGGTFRGETAKRMSGLFSHVYTIEKSDHMYAEAQKGLQNYSNITQLKGDTREHLNEILEKHDNILFWLDAHWSGGNTYGEGDECPLLEELAIIFEHKKNYVILIDDARLFMAPPPLPHQAKDWPSVAQITRSIPDDWDVIIYEDVIYLLHKEQLGFKAFLQETITADHNNKGNFLERVQSKLRK